MIMNNKGNISDIDDALGEFYYTLKYKIYSEFERKIPNGAIVRVKNDPELFYPNALGVVVSFNEVLDEYLVAFVATEDDTNRDFIYESCNYKIEHLIHF